jgi:hypothetical protein
MHDDTEMASRRRLAPSWEFIYFRVKIVDYSEPQCTTIQNVSSDNPFNCELRSIGIAVTN